MTIRKKPNFAHILMAFTVLAMMSACSTVRDTIDWVPGVSSNEEIAAEEKQEAIELAKKEREAYEDKAAFAPTTRLDSTSDAKISVNIGQKFEQENTITREDIGIEVSASVVILTGNVASEDSAINAISIAKSTAGVSRVVSKLVVVNVHKQGRIAVKLPASTK